MLHSVAVTFGFCLAAAELANHPHKRMKIDAKLLNTTRNRTILLACSTRNYELHQGYILYHPICVLVRVLFAIPPTEIRMPDEPVILLWLLRLLLSRRWPRLRRF